MVARLAGLDFPKTENRLVELGRLLQIFDFQCEVDDTVHALSLMRRT